MDNSAIHRETHENSFMKNFLENVYNFELSNHCINVKNQSCIEFHCEQTGPRWNICSVVTASAVFTVELQSVLVVHERTFETSSYENAVIRNTT